MIVIDEELIHKIFPEADDLNVEIFTELFNEYKDKFGIDSEFDIAAFLAQIKVEVGPDLMSKRENLNYTCSSLDIFSYYQEHPDEAQEDGRCNNHEANQVNIGNKAYANRLGNGDIESGDGYRFRGGGYFQLTGRNHYTDMAIGISERGLLITPEVLADHISTTYWGLASAMAYWDKYCDCCDTIDCVTSAINFHTDSYEERKNEYEKIRAML